MEENKVVLLMERLNKRGNCGYLHQRVLKRLSGTVMVFVCHHVHVGQITCLSGCSHAALEYMSLYMLARTCVRVFSIVYHCIHTVHRWNPYK